MVRPLTAHEQSVVAAIQALPGFSHTSQLLADHRALKPGDVFFAWQGQKFDARQFLSEALCKGIVAVVVDDAGAYPEQSLSVPIFSVSNLKQRAGLIAAALLGQPSESLSAVAVTGTNGKTSVTRWVAQCIDALGGKTAVVGTLGMGFVDESLEYTGLTTPDALRLQRGLKTLKSRGATAVAIEASSIGIEQHRLSGMHFDVVAFTNFTRDHLDYHRSMEAYAKAKLQLATWPDARFAVVNLDADLAKEFVRYAKLTGKRVCGVSAKVTAADVDDLVTADEFTYTGTGLSFVLRVNGEAASVVAPVVGDFNLENVLVVAGILHSLSYSVEQIARALTQITPPLGRMQLVSAEAKPLVVVDYAHTPDALERALQALRPVSNARHGRLIVLFGCGGDRDLGKRSLMGAVAVQNADAVYVTSDNPRSENPERIIEQILAGTGSMAKTNLHVEVDRALAIAKSVAAAAANDVVLLAGKGHETTQIIVSNVIPFSDVEHAHAALNVYKVAA